MRMLAVVPGGNGKLSALAGLLILLTLVAAALSGGLILLLRGDA